MKDDDIIYHQRWTKNEYLDNPILLHRLHRHLEEKAKTGDTLKRETLDWERAFPEKQQAYLTMVFSSLVELYFEDMKYPAPRISFVNKKDFD